MIIHFSVNPDFRPQRSRLDWYKQNHDDEYVMQKSQDLQSVALEKQFRALRRKHLMITAVKFTGLGGIIGTYLYTENLWLLGLATLYLYWFPIRP